MTEKTIEQRVKDIIVEQLGVNADQVTPDGQIQSRTWVRTHSTVETVRALDQKRSATRFLTSRPKKVSKRR